MAAGAGAAVAAVVLAVTVWPGGGTNDGASGRTGDGPPPKEARPSPTYPMSKAPQTIPAVAEHEAARGPGWKPGPEGQVVVAKKDADDLADEGRLLAGELQLKYAEGAKAGPGDVELALSSGDAGGEAYTLDVSDQRVRISATDDAGVFYGTRTLKQLTSADGTAPEGVIRDAPAKAQRGFMLDIARKHFSAEWIEERVRELADLKYNQLGLHFSDDQAFRIESDDHPEVVSDPHLTKAEVRRIVKLAQDLHITVIPEIDSPGHLGAVIRAHPELQLVNASGEPARGAVDISKPASAKIVDELLKEYMELFPGGYWHLGADEYRALMASDPEASYPQLARAAQQKYGSGATVQDLATGWLNDRADTVRPSGKKLKAWNDGFFRGGTVEAAEDIEVEYWTGKEIGAREPVEYLDAGRKLVNLNDEYLYYVLGEPNEFTYPTGERIYEEWTPRVLRGTQPVAEKYDDQILGASFAVWCDLSDSQTQAQVADGIRMPLWAMAQKVWDERKPAMSWPDFQNLAKRLG
ncbi:glycoside hydrolase family 20 protein [Streptomyces sp. B-S-A8]|uniref:Glycoside hydrolase family 20 protein n=1 Tax=Streptomyces solicavernae TaxID=3043614 RepID=A0ABT6RMR4_9ACTN|nr:glycoside hydrolase family 20 protein [Streptomyces sp. B-S-A8]MDI3385605.1 glycoside hydrolase family 20 protein [Streptomyces sp. B-S-A8]